MADRVELLNAMRVLKEHCENIKPNHCDECDFKENCECEPCNWDLKDGESDE